MKRRGGITVLYLAAILFAVWGGFSGRTEATQGKQATFIGRVVDAAGKPIEGAQVRLYQEEYAGGAYLPEMALTAQAKTKADGSFSFSVPVDSEGYPYGNIVAEKEGLAIGFIGWDMSRDQKLDIPLGPAQPLAGVIVDESGQPIGAAAVSVYLLQIGDVMQQRRLSMYLASRLLTTRTNATGRFVFTNLPGEATAELLVRTPGRATVCTFSPSEYDGRLLRYPVGQADLRLTQPVEAKIQGTVVETPTGRPLAGITLTATYAGNRLLDGYDPVRVNADGSFALSALPAGQYALQLARGRDGAAEWVAPPVPVMLKAGETRTGLKIQASHGGLLEVAVTEAASNKPLEKATASVRGSQSGQWFHGTSDAEGIARIRLTPGTYQVEGAYQRGYSAADKPETITIEEGATKRVAVALKRTPKVQGVVRDPNGVPVPGAQVKVLPGGRQEVTSDVEGKFEMTWDRQGWDPARTVFCLVARHEQRNLAAMADLAEGTNTLDAKLAPGATIAGRVVDLNGKGIAGAQVSPMLFVGGWGCSLSRNQIQSDGSGCFEVRALPAGHKYDLNVSANGYGSKSTERVDTYGAPQGRLDIGVITLPPANLSVSGRVVDLQDKPVPHATISVYGEGQPGGAHTQADTQGQFTLRGVCAGLVNLEVNANSAGQRLSAHALTEGGSRDIKIVVREGNPYLVQRVGGKTYEQIVAGGAKVIAGVAVDAKGSPVAGVPVQVRCRQTIQDGKRTWTYSDFRELSATTDAQGRFAIEPKEDGEYNLLFSPDHWAAVIAYDVPVGRKDLKVILPEGGTVTGRLVRAEQGRKIAIPGAEIKVEQTSRWSFSHLGFDRDRKTTTDAEGRFRVEHLATEVRADQAKPGFVPRSWKVSSGNTSQTIVFEGDGTTQDIELIVRPDLASAPALVGKPLPSFDRVALDLASEQSKGKPMLVCFFDWEQRPSRNCVLQLAKQAPALREKGLTLVAVHVAKDDAGLRQWVADTKIPFPVGTIQGDREEVLATWSAKSLPWLVLADAGHAVAAEGFTADELGKKLDETAKTKR